MGGDRAILNGGVPNAVTIGAPPRSVQVQSDPSCLDPGPSLGPPKKAQRDPMDLIYGLKAFKGVMVDGLADQTEAGQMDQPGYKMSKEYSRPASPYLTNRGTLKGVARTHAELDAAGNTPPDNDLLQDGLSFEEKMDP